MNMDRVQITPGTPTPSGTANSSRSREIAVPQGEPRRPSSGGPWRFSATSRRSRQTCSAMNMAKMRPNMAKMEPKMAKMGHKMAKMRSQMAKTPLSR